jgi:lipoyl(octanoyl) transferase
MTAITIRNLGECDYHTVFERMREFTEMRNASVCDEIWILQHHPVFTLGQAGKPEHVLDAGEIPLVQSDRGGQVTYHGLGQLVAYTLIDLRRSDLGIRELVSGLEASVIGLLSEVGIIGVRRTGAPGVYVNDAKISALGLRVRRGCAYHGVSLNVDMDLEPFTRINPCGYAGLRVTDMRSCGYAGTLADAANKLSDKLTRQFSARHTRALQ